MAKKIIAVAMNGMNATPSTRDMDVVYPIGQFDKFTSRYVESTVQSENRFHGDEQSCSTLYWHLLHTLDYLSQSFALNPADDVQILFGRGTLGSSSEEELAAMLKDTSTMPANDVFKVIVAKSYGGIDTLKALQAPGVGDAVGRIDLLILLDTTGPKLSVRKVSTKNSRGERLLTIPKFVVRTENIYQREQRISYKHGYRAKGRFETEVFNNRLDADQIDGKYYTYPTGSKYFKDPQTSVAQRKLTTNHFDIEEIVCGVGVVTKHENLGTLHDIIVKGYVQSLEIDE